MNVFVTVDSAAVIAELDRMTMKLSNLAPYLKMLSEIVSQQFEYNFNAQPWPPLAAATIVSKQAQGYPLDILVRTGAMKDAAISGNWQVTNSEAKLEVPAYSGFHFEGTSMMPARDYAFLPTSFVGQAMIVFEEFIGA